MQDFDLQVRQGALLPHWTKEGATYHLCIRLDDSLPQQTLQTWKEEREEIVQNAVHKGKPLTQPEQRRLDFLYSEKVEKYLDSGYGACWLQRDAIADIVANALQYFNGERYQLSAWCIMPNHVHIVAQPLAGQELHTIMRSWKTFTARECNTMLHRNGTFWQREYFDHLIRSSDDLERCIDYVWKNPEEAGLKNWKWRWRIS